MNAAELSGLLASGLHPALVRLYADERAELEREFDRSEVTDDWGLRDAPPSVRDLQRLVFFLQRHVGWVADQRGRLSQIYAAFQQSYAQAVSDRDRQAHVLNLARALGATRRQLNADRRAFRRWFGHDAISERYRRRQAVLDRKITFALGRLGRLSAQLLEQPDSTADPVRLWRRMELEPLVQPLLNDAGDPSVRIESFRCLAAAVEALPGAMRETSLTDRSVRHIYRAALERRQDVWLQCEALTLLGTLSQAALEKALRHRLGQPGEGDDLFVRCRAIRLAGRALPERPQLTDLVEAAATDESPAVRQAVIDVLPQASIATVGLLLPRFLRDDPEPAVRAAAVLAMEKLCRHPGLVNFLASELVHTLAAESETYVLRVALETVTRVYASLREHGGRAGAWLRTTMPSVTALHEGASHLAVRRRAAQVRERLWGLAVPGASHTLDRLATFIGEVPTGRSRRVPATLALPLSDDIIGRSLALLAQGDFGLDLESYGWRAHLTRGHRFRFRSWRLVHEFLHPSTDKRQAFAHTVGRVFRGTTRAPSAILSELAETRVPGEPLFMPSEDGWRPYLPLVDEMISALDQPVRAGPLRIYTSEGITEITPPGSLWRRARSRIQLTLRFPHYARLRNWREGDAEGAAGYVRALCALGFSIQFRPHQDHPDIPASVDSAVTRFFPLAVGLPAVEPLERLKDYFFSVYENNLTHLLWFLTAVALWFFGRHIWVSRSIGRLRNRIPLVIGGWGTRGKSGTERIKAALFNALGHSVVSKTTGCEAMFLHGHANGTLREMFLFRPYDKATIWEQVNVVRIAHKLGAKVFLWECMGLTPSYVAILQQQWMRDDYSTITNTYPDHEDLQGPAGINIPQVMTNFIPRRGNLITTEEQMLPILRADAEAKDTAVRTAGWLEAGLLTSDVLARFPYAEHPYNIALVLKLAEELGIDRDFALKEMADRVVPDLGVLKASPVAAVRMRRLEFVNGMSANERFGCLGNWERMGFARQDPYNEPGVWLMTVVNNRADRVPRSRVFASILVNDIAADVHLLIGTNLDGLMSYVREAWGEAVGEISLYDGAEQKSPLDVLEQSARRLRIPCEEGHVRDRVRAMLEGSGLDRATVGEAASVWGDPKQLRATLADQLQEDIVDPIVRHAERWADNYEQYQALKAKVEAVADPAALDREFRARLWEWFRQKLEIVEDPHADGHQIIARVIDRSPPGLHSRVMGIQNIKGTGLDFVYRWQAWEGCHQACVTMRSTVAAEAERGLGALVAFQDYNMLCEEHVRAVVEEVRHTSIAQSESFQSELALVLKNLDEALDRIRAHLELTRGRQVGLVTKLLLQVEAFLDAGDAVRRRRSANRIYRDLANERISHERAALELQGLNKRQKGGWLQQSLENLLRFR